ncbi:golgin candidate 1-like [Arachis hypogaea]|uniref:golgin candidate 1-like n=1 Tax=Arachis hypogaea TaxID=3818 RepID=UPI003B1DDDF0
MVEALAAKNAEIEALLSSTDALKRQAAQSEGNLASIQVNMESMMRNQRVNRNKDDAGSRRGASICRTKSRRGTCSA